SDKAYTVHTSDSLYLSVLNYFNRRKSDPLYPEVLYYGGRVYSDLGDYPTALDYFQNALDFLADNPDNPNLKATILSQTGRLLNTMRLRSQALPYLKEAVRMDSLLNDSVNLPFDLQLLGSLYMNIGKYKEAESNVRKALELIQPSDTVSTAIMKIYLAAINHMKGDDLSALNIIETIPQNLNDEETGEFFYSYSTDIYYNVGNLDSAYNHAKRLLRSHKKSWGITAHKVLLSEKMRGRLQKEELNELLNNYLILLENYYNQNTKEAIINQNSIYNYSRYEKENLNLQMRSRRILTGWLITIIIAVAAVALVIFLRYKQIQHKIQYLQTLEKIERLRAQLGITEEESRTSVFDNLKEIKAKLEKYNEDLKKGINKEKPKQSLYINTEGYKIIKESVETGKNIGDSSSNWAIIKESFNQITPDFFNVLEKLTRTDLAEEEKRMIILIRYGYGTSAIADIVSKGKSTISERKTKLTKKLFGTNFGVKDLEVIIRLL
ncbi:MAG: tetratricopeptide repeat protein, partial [Muribaculaceae bacterium]|nr:tetratricopeptide repeat protein [Muribaculaceae bacterium]